ncbi:hypothetical protein [Streptomyces sp. NPDC085596]|uniref:hypothetical protein n=1 Tax=Streptomyces sp. NPDC085596 TaxID=3365731 RepID=UPI0037CEBB6A
MSPTATRLLPTTHALTSAQYSGQDCTWCGAPLGRRGAPAGLARGQIGAHVVAVPVFQCQPGIGCQSSAHRPTERNH